MNQSDIAWQLAQKDGIKYGTFKDKDGEVYNLPSWDERKLMRTQADGELKWNGKPEAKNPAYLGEPRTKGGESTAEFVKKVSEYGQAWREQQAKAKEIQKAL